MQVRRSQRRLDRHAIGLEAVLVGIVLLSGATHAQVPIAPAPDAASPPQAGPLVAPQAEETEPPDATPPPEETAPAPPPQTLALLPMRTLGTPTVRLASVPNMMGDFGVIFQSGLIDDNNYEGPVSIVLPLAGGALRTKVSDNNKALPMNRIHFEYNHFHNAIPTDLDVNTAGNEFFSHLDRFTVGLEKTFRDGRASVDVRLPLASSQSLSVPGYDVDSGAVGNLEFVFKHLLYQRDHCAVAAGFGLDLPTGNDVRVDTYVDYTLHNDAVHLSPYLGGLYAPDDRRFYQAFAQIDVPLNGNQLDLDYGSGPMYVGSLQEQTLLQFDASAGYWICRDRHALLTGLAAIGELHYTTTLTDGNRIAVGSDRFGTVAEHLDLLHATIGLHATCGKQTTVRVGAAFPLLQEPDRIFDAELQVSINRYF